MTKYFFYCYLHILNNYRYYSLIVYGAVKQITVKRSATCVEVTINEKALQMLTFVMQS